MGGDYVSRSRARRCEQALQARTAIVSSAIFTIAIASLASGCGGGEEPLRDDSSGSGGRKSHSTEQPDAGGFSNPSHTPPRLNPDAAMQEEGKPVILESLRIEPEDAVLDVDAGDKGKLGYKVFGKLEGATDEVDITHRTVFYVPDNWRIGGFDAASPTFVTNDKEPRGGMLTVQATAGNSDGSTIQIETSLTVRYHGRPKDPRDDGTGAFDVPKNPGKVFDKAKSNKARNPELVYPNDGVVLPPNLHRLSVHFRPGSTDNELYEVSLDSSGVDLVYYVRCGTPVADGCVLELDGDSFQLLADSNRDGTPVQLQVRGTDDDGKAVGSSEVFDLSFARTDVRGGLYYWRTTDPVGIMRVDFGAAAAQPEPFLLKGDTRLTRNDECVGCHAISRDGTKVVASQNGQEGGYLIFINDLSRDPMAADFLTRNGDDQNGIQFASFNPKGDRFAAVISNGPAITNPSAMDVNTLWFHDGNTGEKLLDESVTLPWEPDHPDWSPNGKMIALTHVGIHNTSQMPLHCGIEVLHQDKNGPNNGWSDPETVVPIVDGKSRYNPNFVPDSSFFIFSESICPGGDVNSSECNGDSDPSAKTWAVKPEEGAKPVLLERAAQGGVADDLATDLADTFARVSPFESEYQDGEVYWVTMSSTRRAGLYNGPEGTTQRLLWMFAVDPARVRDGKDGSSPGFYLPFQDLATSNHIAQWTEQIVTDEPPPKPPTPPNPPAPPDSAAAAGLNAAGFTASACSDRSCRRSFRAARSVRCACRGPWP